MIEKRTDDIGLVYKTKQNPPLVEQDEFSRAWNEWAQTIAKREAKAAVETLADVLGAEMGEQRKNFTEGQSKTLAYAIADLRQQLRAELQIEIAALRYEIEQLREKSNGYAG